ncbi:cardiolipin synthase [Robiginitalea sediminis]|uniref:cardiolipin synthase n=1 Tax=Robiginitalea sediminis TaxID=1982593 RepID=UPI000B4B7EDF|nr:cardiolipin synthase [Robiginitalea sediminis]
MEYPLLIGLYFLVVLLVCIRIILHTTTPSKGLGYLLLILGLPVIGILIYFSVGLNYRKRKLYKKKLAVNNTAFPQLRERRLAHASAILKKNKEELGHFYPLAHFQKQRGMVSENNAVSLCINGESKFPILLECLRNARHHIHMEYYIYEDDDIGNQIADILIAKAGEGVQVRFIYDDFGSQGIRATLAKRLREGGVEAYPFHKITFIRFANRINYRNHRKIVVIDGLTGFIGGINVSDKYINQPKNDLYWRDTHLRITGTAVMNLQFTFLTDWNFCAGQDIGFSTDYFPIENIAQKHGDQLVQIVESGPDSDYPNILYSLIQTILLAREEVLITTPYLIPDSSFLNALKISALSGVTIHILVPEVSDSFIVNSTSRSFYQELLEAGVHIHLYRKGFVHAKTLVCDKKVSVVGTANLDNRSFDLNFEINALVFDTGLAGLLSDQFFKDLEDAREISEEEWNKRPMLVRFWEKLLHLFSALM